MLDMIFNIVGSLVLFYSIILCWSKLLKTNINYKSKKFYIVWIFISLFSIVNTFFVNKFFKITILTIVSMFLVKILFSADKHKSIITPIIGELVVMIAEAAFAFMIIILNIDINSTLDSSFIKMISNIMISFIIIIIANMNLICKLYDRILNITEKINKIQLSIFFIILMLIANILAMTPYYSIEFKYLLIFNISMTIMCFSIILFTFITRNNYNRITGKYNLAAKSLKDLEEMININTIKNHENKNQLLTIRAMIINNEKSVIEYIDTIVNKKYNDDEKLYMQISVIPSGGLRAIIYSEILKMKLENINYTLNVDKKIKTIDFIELGLDNISDICNIIGVFIDNSIDAVRELENKNIDISFYQENNRIYIKISNNYKNEINVSKLGNIGYTSKGQNHGYGLAFVKSIVEKNNILDVKREIQKEIFSEILSIKLNQNKDLKKEK